jgi:Asp-tRNA(Asn)/Glu-tRNA(Gln) amidotransferase A subunit family amidase
MTDVPDFRSLTVEELAGRIRTRDLTAAAVTDAALERIERLNPALNAFVAVDPDAARAQAAAIDTRLDGGDDVGPLAGIPIGVKDLEDAAGFVTTHGSVLLAGDPPASQDSTMVARLRAAGCVIVGKTNTPEGGWIGDTFNPLFGATKNPWGANRSPGGSSGGTGSAVASGMVPLGTGSDGGGSIRIPSALNGMSGHKPSQGRVPGGPAPMGAADLSCVGPMARRIRDVALALDVVAGPTPGDLRSLDPPTASYRDALDNPPAPKRVLWAPSIEGQAPDAEILAVCQATVDQLAAAGVEVVETGPVLTDVIGPFALLFYGGKVHEFREAIDNPELFAMVTPGLQEILTMADSLLTADSIEEAREQAQSMSISLAEQMVGFDALLSPLVAGHTPVSEQPGTIDGEPTQNWVSYTYPFNVTRRPAGTTTAGFTADGMPVGLQIVGHQLGDLRTLQVTAWIEDLLGLDPIAPGLD